MEKCLSFDRQYSFLQLWGTDVSFIDVGVYSVELYFRLFGWKIRSEKKKTGKKDIDSEYGNQCFTIVVF